MGSEIEEMAAMRVARVAAPSTVGVWLARAPRRTNKHHREEVELVETRARLERQRCVGAAPPPSESAVEAWFRF